MSQSLSPSVSSPSSLSGCLSIIPSQIRRPLLPRFSPRPSSSLTSSSSSSSLSSWLSARHIPLSFLLLCSLCVRSLQKPPREPERTERIEKGEAMEGGKDGGGRK